MARFTKLFAIGVAAVMLALGSGALLSGCKSDDAPAEKPAAQKAAPAKPAPVKGAPAPAGSKLAKVEKGMTPDQVQEIMGAPTDQAVYPSANTYTPWGNWTKDTGDRLEYKYKGHGRVVFGGQRYGAAGMRVVRVDYDPSEDGK